MVEPLLDQHRASSQPSSVYARAHRAVRMSMAVVQHLLRGRWVHKEVRVE